MFIPILTALLGDDPRVPVAMGEHVENTTAKMRVLFDVAAELPHDRLAKTICAVRDDVEAGMAFRNKLAHALFVFDERTGALELASGFVAGRRGKPKCEPLTVQMVKEKSDVLRKALNQIRCAGAARLRNPMEVP